MPLFGITQIYLQHVYRNKDADVLDASPGQAHPSIGAITTRTFVIRYCDEEVELNDILIFRAEVPVDRDYLSTEFYLEAELMFVDFSSLKSKEINGYVAELHSSPELLKKVSSAKFKVLRCPQVIKEYFPVCFESQYFCQFHCTVHSTLIGYEFKKKHIDSKKPIKENIHFADIGEYFFLDKHGQL